MNEGVDPPGEAPRAIVAQALAMNACGLSQGSSGNLSVRRSGGMLITPSGIPCEQLRPDDIVPMALDGRCEHRLTPSSEWRIHADLYAARPEVGAVVHAHPPHCTALAICGLSIPAVHYMVAAFGGPDVRCAPYRTYGTPELSAAALEAMADRHGCLLANHGMIAVGATLAQAMWRAVEMEALARQYIVARQSGTPVVLPADEIARVVEKFKSYGPRHEAG